MTFRNSIAACALMLAAVTPLRAQNPWSLTINAADFARQDMLNAAGNAPATADEVRQKIRSTGYLSGQGWAEYDFRVPEAGWYTLGMPPNGSASNQDFFIDADVHVFGSVRDRIANAYLTAGSHVFRVQHLSFPGIGPVRGFVVARAGDDIADTIRVDVTSDRLVFRRGEQIALKVHAGGRSVPKTLTVTVHNAANGSPVQSFPVELPASPAEVSVPFAVPCTAEGIYYLSFSADGKPLDTRKIREIEYAVVDTRPAPVRVGELQKTLIKEIDCARQPPDHARGDTPVVRAAFGDYRESGDLGYVENKSDYDFFTYTLSVPEAQKPYLVEVDYPDDADRTFCIGLMERNMMDYPPAGGVDSGGPYALTHRMQTQSYLYYPRGNQVVVSFVNAQTGRKAAAAKIRLYRVEGDLPALSAHASGGRHFGYWIEEGDRWATYDGAPDKSLSGYLLSTERWAQVARYMGVDTLMPTVAVYQTVLYPTKFYDGYYRPDAGPRDPMPPDLVRLLLLVCEKYGLKLLPEFHPTWNGYKRVMVDDRPYAGSPDPKPHVMVSWQGQVGADAFHPYFDPIYPANQNWYVGMLGEFADRYADSPALMGVSLRVMGWAWESRNGWPSLYWGYDDYSVHQFEKDSGIHVPVDDADPKRFNKRYQWLLANAKEQWIDWRCDRLADLYGQVSRRVRQARADLTVVSPVHGDLADTDRLNAARFNDVADYSQIYRECGYDMKKMSALGNVEFFNALYYYGRRQKNPQSEAASFDWLTDPKARTVFAAPGGPNGFLFSNGYFEANKAVDPALMGLEGVKSRGWVGVVNPAGRQYLQRYALAMADADTSFIADGGEGYLDGQPPLREFLAGYRALPAERFSPRQDARDPVAVWQLEQASHFWFYAVNREPYPVTISVRLTGDGAVTEEPSGAPVPVAGGTASVILQPLQLRVFEAPAARGIASVSTGIPDAELKRVKAQVDWLGKLNDAVVAGTLGASLSSGQKNALADAAADARREIAVKHVWQAEMRLRHHLLLPIYRQLGQEPPGTASDSPTANGIAPIAKRGGGVAGVPVAKMVGGAVVVVSALGGIGIRRALTLASRKKP